MGVLEYSSGSPAASRLSRKKLFAIIVGSGIVLALVVFLATRESRPTRSDVERWMGTLPTGATLSQVKGLFSSKGIAIWGDYAAGAGRKYRVISGAIDKGGDIITVHVELDADDRMVTYIIGAAHRGV